MTTPSEVLSALIGVVGSAVWFWHDKKRTENEIKDLKKTLAEMTLKLNGLENTRITETRSRAIAEEINMRTHQEVSEIKGMVATMLTQMNELSSNLQSHTAVQQALKEHSKHSQE